MGNGGWLFECDVPGPPIGKGRPRGTTQGGFIKLYTPKKTADWERSCAFGVRSQWSGAPLEGAVEIEFVAVFPRPKRLLRKKDPEGRLKHTTKPDIDNIEKCLLDSLVMAGVLRDDKGVCDVRKKKRYSSKVEGPCLYFRLRQLDEKSIDDTRWFD